MKRITKAQAKQFAAALKAAALEIGFRPFISDPAGHGRYEGAMWIMTDRGRYLLHGADTESGDTAFWVYGRFLEPARLLRSFWSQWNTHSGKWNFHAYTAEEAIKLLRRAMELVNSRPATPEEIAEYDAADLAEYAKWEAFRKEGV